MREDLTRSCSVELSGCRVPPPLGSPLEEGRCREDHLTSREEFLRMTTDYTLPRRDPPLVEISARCPPPLGGERNHHSHRSDDGESEFHGDQRAPFALSDLYPRTDTRSRNRGISREEYGENRRTVS